MPTLGMGLREGKHGKERACDAQNAWDSECGAFFVTCTDHSPSPLPCCADPHSCKRGGAVFGWCLSGNVTSWRPHSRTVLLSQPPPSVSPQERKKLLSFVIVGGGPTGVEVAAELYDMIQDDLRCSCKVWNAVCSCYERVDGSAPEGAGPKHALCVPGSIFAFPRCTLHLLVCMCASGSTLTVHLGSFQHCSEHAAPAAPCLCFLTRWLFA
jgi:hypothetical protein